MKSKKMIGLGKLPQTEIDWTKTVHVRENKQSNEDHLNANRQKFTGQCAIVLSLLQQGHVLSSYTAMTQWHIGHLPRRIKDLKDEGGVIIEDQFELDSSGKATRNKIWFIREYLTQATIDKYKIEKK